MRHTDSASAHRTARTTDEVNAVLRDAFNHGDLDALVTVGMYG